MSQNARDAADFGSWLTERMAERGISAAELAGCSEDFSTRSVAQWMSGQAMPGVNSVPFIAEALGAKLDETLWLAGYARVAKEVAD